MGIGLVFKNLGSPSLITIKTGRNVDIKRNNGTITERFIQVCRAPNFIPV